MIPLQLIRKIILSLFPLLILYLFKSRNGKRKHKTSFIVDKNNVEEGEIIEEKE